MPSETVTRAPISLDKLHLNILTALQQKLQREDESKCISRSEVVRRALRALAEANNIR